MEVDTLHKHHKVIMKLIGIWPGSNLQWKWIILFTIGNSLFFFIPMVWDTAVHYYDVEYVTDKLITDCGNCLVTITLIGMKLKRNSVLWVLNEQIKDFTEQPKNDELHKNRLLSKKISILMIIGGNAMLFHYLFRILFWYTPIPEDRVFFVGLKYPFDAKQSPVFEIISFALYCHAILTVNLNAVMQGMLAFAALHAGAKGSMVRKEIQKFSNICQRSNQISKSEKKMAIKRLITLHEKFCEFCEKIEDSYWMIALANVILITIMESFSIFNCIDKIEKRESFGLVIHHGVSALLFFGVNLYHAVAGEHIIHQCELIYDDLYDCYWYGFEKREKYIIYFMMIKAQKSAYLTAGKLAYLSYENLAKILKATYSFISLARAS